MQNGPEDTHYTVSDKGWMDSICFLDERSVVLIFDGHKSHVSVPLIQAAVRNDVILLKLPPNSTNSLQPLDVGVYGPLKTAWLGAALTKDAFPSLLKKLWLSGCVNVDNIKGRFCKMRDHAIQSRCSPKFTLRVI